MAYLRIRLNTKMRYKCVSHPKCLKIFDNGTSLRAHLTTCSEAQKILKQQEKLEKFEQHIGVEYPGIHGLHANTFFPTTHDTDRSNKYQFKDRFRFNGKTSIPDSFNNQSVMRPQRAKTQINLHKSHQVKSALSIYND